MHPSPPPKKKPVIITFQAVFTDLAILEPVSLQSPTFFTAVMFLEWIHIYQQFCWLRRNKGKPAAKSTSRFRSFSTAMKRGTHREIFLWRKSSNISEPLVHPRRAHVSIRLAPSLRFSKYLLTCHRLSNLETRKEKTLM